MRGYKPYSPDDERFEVIFKDMRTEEAYADIAFPGDPEDLTVEEVETETPEEVAEVETDNNEEAVESSETDWEDVTEDFHIETVPVAETAPESVPETFLEHTGDAEDANDGSDAGFDNPHRAEIDLELHKTVAEGESVEDEPAVEDDFSEPAWDADEDTEISEEEDDAALVELVRYRLENEEAHPLPVLIKELGLEDSVSLEDELETGLDDSLDDDTETSMELDLSFVEDEDDEEESK